MATKIGYWKIEFTIEPTESDLEHIAQMIEEGYTEGQIVQETEDEEETEED